MRALKPAGVCAEVFAALRGLYEMRIHEPLTAQIVRRFMRFMRILRHKGALFPGTYGV